MTFTNPPKNTDTNIKTYGTYIHTQQNKMLAHIVRSENSDPLRQATLRKDSILPFEYQNKRVGRPRKNGHTVPSNAWHTLTHQLPKLGGRITMRITLT